MFAPDATPVLRAGMAADLVAARALITSADLPTDGLDALFTATPPAFLVVCEKTAPDTLLATAGLEQHGAVALLRSVAVRADQRGIGLGRRVVAHALEDAAQRGVHTVYLLTTSAASFFEGMGFVRTTRDTAPAAIRATAQFAGGCASTAVAMMKTLP